MADQLDFVETGAVVDGEYRLHFHEAGEGPVLILLHGSGPGVSGWSNFRGNLPVFAASFRTIILDMPGFGLSQPVPIDRPYSQIAADSVRSLMDDLGVDRAHVLGDSMGGSVCGHLTLAHPDRVERIVMMGPGGFAVERVRARRQRGRQAPP